MIETSFIKKGSIVAVFYNSIKLEKSKILSRKESIDFYWKNKENTLKILNVATNSKHHVELNYQLISLNFILLNNIKCHTIEAKTQALKDIVFYFNLQPI